MIHKTAFFGASLAALALAAPATANADATAGATGHEPGIELLLEDSAETAAPAPAPALPTMSFGTWGVDPALLSATAKPGDDFNAFVNQPWIDANPLPSDFSLALHAGYSDGDYWDAVNDGGYFDYSVGVNRTIGNFALTLKWVDGSDLASSDGTPGDVFTSESKVWFSIATTLPWAK